MRTLNTPVAIVVTGAMIALAIVFVGRWQVSGGGGGGAWHAFRIDRWSGKVEACTLVTIQGQTTC